MDDLYLTALFVFGVIFPIAIVLVLSSGGSR